MMITASIKCFLKDDFNIFAVKKFIGLRYALVFSEMSQIVYGIRLKLQRRLL